MSLVRISKAVVSCIEEEAISLSVFCYLITVAVFNPIFMSFVAISSVLCPCFKAVSVDVI